MKHLIQIAFAILIALQLIETLPSRAMARVFPDVPDDASALPPNITVANKTSHHNSTKHSNTTKPTNTTKPVVKPVDKPVVKPVDKPVVTPTKPGDKFNHTSDGKRDIPVDDDANSSNTKPTKPADGKPVVDPKKQNALDKNKPFDPNTMPFDEGKFGHEKPSGGLSFYKPNFQMRITEKLAELAQEELLVYL